MKKKWWHGKTAYQIYPKSFYDTNGDGIGDIPGIIDKLDYLQELGIEILWLSPVYVSPCADQGYDIADYYAIDPKFGTMEDMDRLLEEAKKRGIAILMDLVVNHCSDEHEWFKKALEDPDGEYGQYFYIEDMKDGKIPTNWSGYFGGEVWEPIPGTDKCYLHVFHKKQPDLNWENPKLREEIYKMVNRWLDKGLAGFRIDAIVNIKKPLPFTCYPADRDDGRSSMDQVLKHASGIGEFLGELRDRTFAPHDALTIGEVFNVSDEEMKDYIGENGYFSSMFDFRQTLEGKSILGWLGCRLPEPDDYKRCCFESQAQGEKCGYLANIIENHDEPRGVSHYSRDNARTPFQWDDSANAGFTSGTPWLVVNEKYKRINAAEQMSRENSVFSYYKRLIALRKDPEYAETIVYGRTEPALMEEKDVMAYFRRGEGQDLFVIGNFDRVSRTVQIDDVTSQTRVLLDNCGTYEIEDGRITLQPYQALVFAL